MRHPTVNLRRGAKGAIGCGESAIPTRERADDQNLRRKRIAHRTAASSAPSGKMDGRAAALVT